MMDQDLLVVFILQVGLIRRRREGLLTIVCHNTKTQ